MDTDYADDMATLDNINNGLQESTDLLSKHCSYGGLKINASKTKTMAFSKNTGQRPYNEACTIDIIVDGIPVEQVSQFIYLGAVISGDGKIDYEITARIQKAAGAFNQLGKIWKNRNIFSTTKVRIYKAAVITILNYGSETWNIASTQMKRLEVFHQRCLRRILKIK